MLPGEDGSPFFIGEFFPLSDGKVAEGKGADAFAEKSEARMTDGGCHATNLTIFAFAKFETQPGVDDVFAIANRRVAVGNGRGLLEQFGPAREAFVALNDESAAAEFFE